MNVNIGIEHEKRQEIAKGLEVLLADSYALFLKSHNYHWNVKGPMFNNLHALFEEQYNALFEAVDEIAERIRILGFRAPGSFSEFSELSNIKDECCERSAHEMIHNLLEGNEQIVRDAKALMPILDGSNDEGSIALVGARVEHHEKAAWILRSLLED